MNPPGVIIPNKEESETLFFAINQLTDTQKVVFTLYKVDGESYQEISDIINESL